MLYDLLTAYVEAVQSINPHGLEGIPFPRDRASTLAIYHQVATNQQHDLRDQIPCRANYEHVVYGLVMESSASDLLQAFPI